MKQVLLYTYLFILTACTPVLIVYSSAQDWLNPVHGAIPAAAILAGVIALFLLFLRVGKCDAIRACNLALLTTLFLTLYKYLSINITDHLPETVLRSAGIYSVYSVALLFFGAALFILLRYQKDTVYFAGALVHTLVISYTIGIHGVFTGYSEEAYRPQPEVNLIPQSGMPDIIYIVPDCYASGGITREYFGFDNTPFLDALKARGFFVSSGSRSNYLQTRLSLASSLNMEYVETLLDIEKSRTEGAKILHPIIMQNRVMNLLGDEGYDISIAPTLFSVAANMRRMLNADHSKKYPDLFTFWNILKDFSVIGVSPEDSKALLYYRVHDRVLLSIAELLREDEKRRPMFVYGHLLLPHPPFVVDDDGHSRGFLAAGDYIADGGETLLKRWRVEYPDKPKEFFEEYFRQGYINNVKFFNERFLRFADMLHHQHTRPYVLIVQGDHGCAPMGVEKDKEVHARSHILNAYYFSDGNYEGLYDGISPVNSFRAVFNRYFQANLPLHEDVTYSSSYDQPFVFKAVH